MPCVAKTQKDLEQALQDSGAVGLLFSPNSQAGESKYIDLINQSLPELASGNKKRKERNSGEKRVSTRIT